MYIDNTKIYFINGKQFCQKTLVYLVIPRNLGKIVKSMLPKLTYCFIQVGRKIGQCICRCPSIVKKNRPMGLSLSVNRRDK